MRDQKLLILNPLNFGFQRKKKIKKIKISGILEFPPSNEKQLLYTLAEYMKSPYFSTPISYTLLMNNLKKINENFQQCAEILENLDFMAALDTLKNEGAIEVQKNSVGAGMDFVITTCDKNICVSLAKEHHIDKPKEMPKIDNNKDWAKEIKERQRDQRLYAEIKQDFVIKTSIAPMEIEEVEELEPEICEHETRENCYVQTSKKNCMKTHYYKLILPETNELLGLCEHKFHKQKCAMSKCKYIHYTKEIPTQKRYFENLYKVYDCKINFKKAEKFSQWINCDLRHFDYNILGKFDAIMLDPPWDIHMNLPYGTLKDKEMLALNVKQLQDNGVCFLWVTMRALELGRDCLKKWGYDQVEELVWIKTNNEGVIIRTGRTGHWLNHSKEHCLIGIKGDTSKLNRNIDCDVLLSQVRETSRKPDEIYTLIERMSPGGRKCELFARPHNRRKGWVSLGNQLPGINIVEEDVLQRFKDTYPKLDVDSLNNKENQDFINKVYHGHLN